MQPKKHDVHKFHMKYAVIASISLWWHRSQHLQNKTAGMDHKLKVRATFIFWNGRARDCWPWQLMLTMYIFRCNTFYFCNHYLRKKWTFLLLWSFRIIHTFNIFIPQLQPHGNRLFWSSQHQRRIAYFVQFFYCWSCCRCEHVKLSSQFGPFKVSRKTGKNERKNWGLAERKAVKIVKL